MSNVINLAAVRHAKSEAKAIKDYKSDAELDALRFAEIELQDRIVEILNSTDLSSLKLMKRE